MEALFKAMEIGFDDRWVEGYYVRDENNNIDYIYSGKYIESGHYMQPGYLERKIVQSGTVCRYTGLVDKNGNKIFEGDIIKLDNSLVTIPKNYGVKFAYGQFYIGINGPVAYVRDRCEVIGNIHENPELLEVKK